MIEYIKNQMLNKTTLIIMAVICGAIIKHFTPTEIDRMIDQVLLTCGVPESALKTIDSIVGDSVDNSNTP